MVKNVLAASVSVLFLAACGVPDAELTMSDDIQGEAEIMEAGQDLTSSSVASWFPLQKGNSWTFQSGTDSKTITITSVGSGVAFVTGLHEEGKWVGTSASSPNTLYAWDSIAGRWNVFIRFGYAVTPWRYKQAESGCQTFDAKRSATGQSYTTAAGTFTDTRSISFEMVGGPTLRCMQGDFTEITFAAKTGPVFIRGRDGAKFGLKSAKVGALSFPKVTGAVTVKTTTDKVSYVNQSNTIRCITTPCPSNEVTAEAKVTILMVNATNETQSFKFTSCHTNVEVIDPVSGKTVKNLAALRMCMMAVTNITLAPGASKSWVETVPLVSDSGEQLRGTYKIKGIVEATSPGWTGPLFGTTSVNVSIQ